MPLLKIVTQTDSIETGKPGVQDNWMDDCAWATLACAANYLTGSKMTSKDAIAVGETVGRHDRDGFPDPTSLAQLVLGAKKVGLVARYAKSWDDVLKALKAGAVIGINVQQAKNYPPVTMSAWHRAREKRKPNQPYGHMTCAALYGANRAQWADPTMTGKRNEEYAVVVTFEELKQIASSKGDAPHKRCLIFTKKPVVPPKKPVQPKKVVSKVNTLLSQVRKAVTRNV
jgi:hypothetical protein